MGWACKDPIRFAGIKSPPRLPWSPDPPCSYWSWSWRWAPAGKGTLFHPANRQRIPGLPPNAFPAGWPSAPPWPVWPSPGCPRPTQRHRLDRRDYRKPRHHGEGRGFRKAGDLVFSGRFNLLLTAPASISSSRSRRYQVGREKAGQRSRGLMGRSKGPRPPIDSSRWFPPSSICDLPPSRLPPQNNPASCGRMYWTDLHFESLPPLLSGLLDQKQPSCLYTSLGNPGGRDRLPPILPSPPDRFLAGCQGLGPGGRNRPFWWEEIGPPLSR